jgi:hypothetical protein
MKKDLINLLIGFVLIFVGYYFVSYKNTFIHYLSVLILIYGVFVIIGKSLKILLLVNGEFKNIRQFENKQNLQIPNFISQILKLRIKCNKEITFETPFFGTFYILNYHNNKEENHENPHYIINEINYFIKQSLDPLYNFRKIIPFAHNKNYGVLFIEENDEKIIFIDLNNSNFKPFVLDKNIGFYLDLKKMTMQNNIYHYNGLKKIENIMSENDYFYAAPDCIFDGNDYVDIFRKAFKILDSKIDFSLLKIEEKDDKYFIEIEIENQIFTTYFNKHSDYIDNQRITIVLNEILILIKYIPTKKFYLLSTSFCDFGIAIADQNTYQKLKENGCIEFDMEQQKITVEEVNIIRKRADLITEIENIEFHIKVIKENSKDLQKGNQYHFTFETKYSFDDEGIIELKNRLKVIIVKIELGYEIFFNK